MTLEGPVGMHNNVHSLGVLHLSRLGVGGIAMALCAGQHCLLSIKGFYTAVKSPRIEEFNIFLANNGLLKTHLQVVQTPSGNSGESEWRL